MKSLSVPSEITELEGVLRLHSRNKLYAKRYHATQVVQDRINIINSLSSTSASLAIKDLASAEGTSAGTQVNLKVPLDWMDSLDKNMDEV